jgi:hypothetical protein
MAPPTGSLPLPRWVRGPLSVCCRPGTPTYRQETKTRSRMSNYVLPHVYNFGHYLPTEEGSDATMCPTAPDSASLLRRALVSPCVPQLWTLPPYREGLRCCHASHSSKPASLLRRALVLPCVPRLSRGHGPQM